MPARASKKRQPEAPAPPPPPPPSPRYSLDPDWYEACGRSLTAVLLRRMCPKHQRRWSSAKVRLPPEEAFTTFRMCCSRQDDFLSPGLALGEAIFRVLLAEGNQPASAEEVAQRLEAWNTAQDRARDASASTIHRLLERDQFYGFRREDTASGTSG